MGKRIIQQRRGRGTSTYRVRRKSFRHKVQYPSKISGKGKVLKLFGSGGHSCPLAKISLENSKSFYVPAFKGMVEKQEIDFDEKEIQKGQIRKLKDIPVKTQIYCLESRPGDGGKFVKSAGNYVEIVRKVGEDIFVLMPSKKEKKFNGDCRAIIGEAAGAGRLEKPLLKAGKKYFIAKTKSKLWPRTSAVKMNAIDHPFGSGRSKNVKSKVAKKNASPGQKVGLIRPKRTGRRKRK